MRVSTTIIASVAAIAIATALPNAASAGPRGGGGLGMHHGFGAGGIEHLEHRLDRLAEYLDLTETQQAQIRSILDQELPAIRDLRDQMHSAREAFMEGRTPGDFNEAELRAFAESQAALHVEMAVAGARTKSRVYNVLTEIQREQLGELRDLMRPRRGARPGGGRMGS